MSVRYFVGASFLSKGFSLLALVCCFQPLIVSGSVPHLLTDAQALAIIEQREAVKESRYQALKQEMAAAEVVQSKVIQAQGRPLTINRIKPLALKNPVQSSISESQVKMTPEEAQAYLASQQAVIPEQISMSANVYDDAYSEITWRDTETGEEYTVWTNVSLNYLRPVSTIQAEGYDYMYFGFVSHYTSEGEAVRMELAKEHGFEAESRMKSPPVRFSGTEPEYIVLAEDPAGVPEKLYRQLDALIGYYAANSAALEIEYMNSRTLAAAREKYLEENPPQPRETVVNFWKIEDAAPTD